MLTAELPLPKTVNGVPFHPLAVHAVVVLIPLAVIGAIGISVWPAMRRHLGLLVVLIAFAGLVSVPIATSSGEAFRDRLGAAQLVRQHQHYAEKLLPLAAILFVLLALMMVVDLARRLGPVLADVRPESAPAAPAGGGVAVAVAAPTQPTTQPTTGVTTRLDRTIGRLIPAGIRTNAGLLRAAQPVLSVLTVGVALVLAYYCYKTGDSGAKAVWQGR